MYVRICSQTPTLNAAPIVRGVVEACSRGGKNKQGIEVTMILGLGFNDKGESVPFQGGTNEVSEMESRAIPYQFIDEDSVHIVPFWLDRKWCLGCTNN